MLDVTIVSFSYKNDPPFDMRSLSADHGGGFVFDCRCVPNPGREPRFAAASGLDADVAAYLEARPEAKRFFDSVEALVEQAVHHYRERGFTSLLVAFGCTGGQHRSVYFAELLAAKLRGEPGVRVSITHRESEHWGKKRA
jgi:RNase adaptor protein for sRNA GlmZ degradation